MIHNTCKCGCWQIVQDGKVWLHGHNVSERNRQCWRDSTYRKIATARNRKQALAQWTETFRSKRSIEQSVYMKNHPGQWQAMRQAACLPEVIEKTSKAVSRSITTRNLQNWKNPEYRTAMTKRHSTTMQSWWANHPEARVIKAEKMRATATRLWSDPKHRQLISKSSELRARSWFRYPYKTKKGQSVFVKSKAELAYARYLDSKKTVWEYEPTALILENGARYIPDFRVGNGKNYVEVKGWPWNYEKFDAAVAQGHDVKLVLYAQAIRLGVPQ